jgi:hypothetical protein
MPVPFSRLLTLFDAWLPPTGTVGQIALLTGNTTTATFTYNASTGVLTTSGNHLLVTGSKFRLSVSGGALPGTAAAGVDYFAQVLSANTLKICSTLANAQAGTSLTFTDNGSGTMTLTEQLLSYLDPLNVLLNREMPGANGYNARIPCSNIGSAIIVGTVAQKNFFWTQNAVGSTLSFRHMILLEGGNNAIGDSTGTLGAMETSASVVSISAGNSQVMRFQPNFGNKGL